VLRGKIENRIDPIYYTIQFIENERKLKQANFEIKTISELTSLVSDGTHFTPIYQDTGIKFLSVKDVRPFEIYYEDCKYIDVKEAEKLDKRCKPQVDDILLTKVGATYGFAARIKRDIRFQIFVSLALLRPNIIKINPEYFEFILNFPVIYVQFTRALKGAAVPDLHLEEIRKIKIPVPTFEKQQEIVNLLNKAIVEKKTKEKKAKELLNGIDDDLLNELGIAMSEKQEQNIFTTNFLTVKNGRLDPFYYQDYFQYNIESIKNGKCPAKNLKDYTTNTRISNDSFLFP